MIKRVIGGMILVPVIIVLSFWGVNFVSGILSGEINFVTFLVEHKFIIAIITAWFVFQFVNPFKK